MSFGSRSKVYKFVEGSLSTASSSISTGSPNICFCNWVCIVFSLLEIQYSLAAPGKSCDEHCDSLNLKCVSKNAFPNGNARDIFRSLNIECKGAAWAFRGVDNPAYDARNDYCYGVDNIPPNFACCTAFNTGTKRLCPCSCPCSHPWKWV